MKFKVCFGENSFCMQSDDKLIEDFVAWLRKRFPRLVFLVKKPLKEIFQPPSKYRNFWACSWAHADISVWRHGRLVAILEPGGYQHAVDGDQKDRDRKKRLICEEFGVSFLPIMNATLNFRNTKQFRKLLKAAFYREGVKLS